MVTAPAASVVEFVPGLIVTADTPAGAARNWMSLTVTGWAPEPVQFTLPMLGAHNAHNAVAALVCAHAAGAPQAAILAGLTGFQAVRGRTACLHLRVQGQPVQLVDDTYNANPDSVAAAIAALSALKGPRALILGDMGDVGEQGPAFHADVGRLAAQAGVDRFWTGGDLMRHAHDAWLEAGGARDAAQHFEHLDELMAQAKRQGPWAATWVKGSRFMRMERVVAALKENHDVD
jgi:UDP-N-acetylmuramyl pentapeptide synthase